MRGVLSLKSSLPYAVMMPTAKSILLVEDDRLVAHNLSRLLKQADYQVTVARSVADGYRAAMEAQFDLMIFDIGLPDGSGLELACRLREQQHAAPFIFLTAYQDEAVVRAGIDLGAFSYVVKPVLDHQLLPLVESALASLEREAENTAKLRAAIDSNRTISVAAGMLAARYACTPDEAIAAMRKHARDNQLKLETLASQIVAGEKPDLRLPAR